MNGYALSKVAKCNHEYITDHNTTIIPLVIAWKIIKKLFHYWFNFSIIWCSLLTLLDTRNVQRSYQFWHVFMIQLLNKTRKVSTNYINKMHNCFWSSDEINYSFFDNSLERYCSNVNYVITLCWGNDICLNFDWILVQITFKVKRETQYEVQYDNRRVDYLISNPSTIFPAVQKLKCMIFLD